MVKLVESALKIVTVNKRKWLLRLSQMAMEVGGASACCALVTHKPPGQKRTPNPTYFCKWNVGTPYRSPLGTAGRKVRPWRCGNRNEDKANAIL
jgi:hypothetical protein